MLQIWRVKCEIIYEQMFVCVLTKPSLLAPQTPRGGRRNAEIVRKKIINLMSYIIVQYTYLHLCPKKEEILLKIFPFLHISNSINQKPAEIWCLEPLVDRPTGLG